MSGSKDMETILDGIKDLSMEEKICDEKAHFRNYNKNIMNAISILLKSKYYKNQAVASSTILSTSHEKYISMVLKECGFREVEKPIELKREDAMKWIENPELSTILEEGTYILQPFGTQASPDFIIKINAIFVLFLEAKSCKGYCPQYNSGGVHPGFLYVFCSKKTDETTIFLGKDIITPEQNKLIVRHIEDARKRDKIFNEEMKKIDKYNRGWGYYTRPMFVQKGGNIFTNYFEHKDREKVEQNALIWLNEKCSL
jgi:hypothetical protein